MVAGLYFSYFSLNILLESAAIFTLFKHAGFNNGRLNGFVQKLAKYTFGAYLAHALILEQLDLKFGLDSLSFNPIASVFCIGVVTLVISYVISAILNHVPYVNRYMV